MIIFLHNRYRTTGGEERVVENLLWLVSEHLGEEVRLLARDSTATGRARAAAGLLYGGMGAGQVQAMVSEQDARVVHAHNLHPTLGWRALLAARRAGARIILHLHQYRLVCAIGVCFRDGEECTRCHGRNTLPGVLHNCRGDRSQALTYAAALALWQRRMLGLADAVIVPSQFARRRLQELGVALPDGDVHVLPPPLRQFAEGSRAPSGGYALVVSRLAPEKGVDVAIAACRQAGMPLLIAGDGPELQPLRAQAPGADVRFLGPVGEQRLSELRAGASIALVPSRSGETFGLAAAEAMAAGLPVAASRVGALPELVDPEGLVPAGDPDALAGAIERLRGDQRAGERALDRVREQCSPEVLAGRLAGVYGGAKPATTRPL
jgi:glycosyltransferase involved in cell wall biosynthesis